MTSNTENFANLPGNPENVSKAGPGRVCLIGAGPGDPGLLTVKGLERLRQADVVVYDALANPVLLTYVKPGAQLIDAGKRSKQHKLTQDQTQALLAQLAREHKLVVRLKGGDPYLFGRGAEEAMYLAEQGVDCEVVPGVTSGIAAPAMAGIPVTHRAIASTVTFVTGHEDPTKDEAVVDYAALAKLASRGGTLCFYMGVGRLQLIAKALADGGLDEKTPVAVVQWGAHPTQRSIRSTLAHASDDVVKAGIAAPAMIVVGQVASLQDQGLNYFTRRPLFGRRILVTRSRQQASSLRQQLEELGALVHEAPTIEFEPPASWQEVDQAIQNMAKHDWLVITSATAAGVLADRMAELKIDGRGFAGVKIAAVGQATAAALREQTGLCADLVPESALGTALAQAMIDQGVKGSRILALRADLAGQEMVTMLRDAGATVIDLVAYQTRAPESLPDEVLAALRENRIDWVTFTSASTAKNLAALLGDDAALLQKVRIASIGPVTSEAVASLGFEVTAAASSASIDALVQAIIDCERQTPSASNP